MLERTHNLDVASIYQLYETFTATLKGRDPQQWAALWAENAILMSPNSQRRQGVENIVNEFGDLIERHGRDIKYLPDEVKVLGPTAQVYGRFEWRRLTPTGEAASHRRGNFLDILQKQPDGAWKLRLVCFTFETE